MLATRSTSFQPVMLNFIRPEAVQPIGNKSVEFYYNPLKQTSIYMGGGGGNGGVNANRTDPYETERRIGPGTLQHDTAYGD